MPLPLPDLDTRRWVDLVDEGRALIPRYASAWTDHNIHDPGITLGELFAAQAERLMYQANRVPERLRRKWIALSGVAPWPARGATGIAGVTLAPGTAPFLVPGGLLLEGESMPALWIPFRTRTATTLVPNRIVAVQVFDGKRFIDRTRAWREGVPVAAFGPDPVANASAAASSALYIGLDTALPLGVTVALGAVVGAGWSERQRILSEEEERRDDCNPTPRGCRPCLPRDPWCEDDADASGGTPGSSGSTTPVPQSGPVTALPPHHSARLQWEYFGAGGWKTLSGTEAADDTRSLTLDGIVRLELPAAQVATAVGVVAAPLFWLRVRLVRGAFDEAPILQALLLNALEVVQQRPVLAKYTVAPGAAVSGTPVPGTRQRLALEFAPASELDLAAVTVSAAGTGNGVDAFVVDWKAPTAVAAGSLMVDFVCIGVATGLAELGLDLPEGDVADGALRLAAAETGIWREWTLRADLDAALPAEPVAMHDGERGIVFGDGVRGHLLPLGSPIVATWDATSAERGVMPRRRPWRLAANPFNTALLGALLPTVSTAIELVVAPAGAEGGRSAETTDATLARIAASVWAHEQLARLAEPEGNTLDQFDPVPVMAISSVRRTATTFDLEREARGVAGTHVRRARAWAGVDPLVACADAPGTVTVVIVPSLPLGAPEPSAGLVRAVSRWLGRRRVLCTRVIVIGPRYVDVQVTASVRALPSADRTRIAADVQAAIAAFLDPLTGGPAGRGWPFGRDVYRSEILALIDGVRGVDHVLSLTLAAGSGVASGDDEDATPSMGDGCGNLCISARSLVRSSSHLIEVLRA